MLEHRTVHTSIKCNSTFTSTTMPVTWRVPRTSVVTYPLLTAISPAIATARRPVSSTWLMQPSPLCGSAKSLGLEEIGAMCNIMYCFSALELSDVYGPFPWNDYKNDVQEPPVTYEPMDLIYDSLFVNLKDAGKILKNFSSTTQEHQDSINQVLAKYDKICGDVKTWEQFSNSIRLRMAMRMSNINPDRAKAEAQSAIDDGLIEKSIEYNTMAQSGTNHPLAFISILWNDTRMNASLENIMKRLKVPFMEKIFAKNSDAIRDINGEITWPAGKDIVGVRTGISLMARDDNNPYLKYSGLTSEFANFPLAIFKLSERYFLQAEAALRWNIGGSVNTNYLRGVAAMFDDYNIAQNRPRLSGLLESRIGRYLHRLCRSLRLLQ